MHDEGAKSTHFCELAVAPDMIAVALGHARSFAETMCLGEDTAKLAIIVEELLFNLMDYGAPPAGDRVMLHFAAHDDGVRLTIDDPGTPFDPRSVSRKGNLPPERGGGAGLALVRAWSRIESYALQDGRNRTTLLIPIDRP